MVQNELQNRRLSRYTKLRKVLKSASHSLTQNDQDQEEMKIQNNEDSLNRDIEDDKTLENGSDFNKVTHKNKWACLQNQFSQYSFSRSNSV